MNIQALILRVINQATTQLVDMVQTSGLFARSVAAELDMGDIASELDVGDIAYEIDCSQIAGELDYSHIADEIDYSQLAEEVDRELLASLAPAPVTDGALSQMSQQVLEAAVTRLLNMANAHVENGS